MTHERPPQDPIPRAARRALRELFRSLPDAFDDKVMALQELRYAFHAELASAFEPVLREQILAQPLASESQRIQAAIMTTMILERLGLRAFDESTRRRGVLSVATEGRDAGRFHLFSEADRLCAISDDFRDFRVVPEAPLVPSPLSDIPAVWSNPGGVKGRGR